MWFLIALTCLVLTYRYYLFIYYTGLEILQLKTKRNI